MLSRFSRECRRFASGGSNFAKAAGFHENTDSSDYANKTVLIHDNGSLTFKEFNGRIGQYASVLTSKLGLSKGDRLIARTTKNIDNLALYFATLQIGAIFIPLNPSYLQKETTHFVNDSKPRVLVTCNPENDKSFVESVKHVIDENVLAKDSAKVKPMHDVENVASNDIASVCYTSGTTGLPKGAEITHGGITANAETCADIWKFSSNDLQYHVLPANHIHGLFISQNCSFITRSPIIWQPKFTVENALKWLPKATVMMGVPTYFHRLIHDDRFSKDVVKNIRLFVSGSAPLSPSVWEDFRKLTGIPILERYGMTETLVSTSNPYEESKRIPGSVGLPVPGVQVRINKDEVLEYKGPSAFKGYWNLPEKTKQEFTSDGWFITGDVARIDENGYVYIMGRGKDMIISGGLNVYPKEVEDIIDDLEIVRESAIIAAPHADFGEAVVAVAVKSKKGEKLTDEEFEKAIIKAVKENLAPYKVPKKVFALEDMPRNALGKILKKQLRETYKNLFP
jgi:malonyl-CoA/methylmalonyl-CoA synthetase